MTIVVLAFALFLVRFVAAEASYQRAQRIGSGYRFPVGVGLRITYRLGGPFLIFVGFKMAQQASGRFDWSTSGLVALLGLGCLLAEPGEIVASSSGVTQKTLLGIRSKHISWEGAAARFVPDLREVLIIGHDGTAITHSQHHVGQSQLVFELEKHGVAVQK